MSTAVERQPDRDQGWRPGSSNLCELFAGRDIEYGTGDQEPLRGADAQSGRSQCWSFRREQLPGARKIICRVCRAMRVQGDMHGRTGRDMEIAQRALKRQPSVVPGDGAIHSSEHPGGITRWHGQIRGGTLVRDEAR